MICLLVGKITVGSNSDWKGSRRQAAAHEAAKRSCRFPTTSGYDTGTALYVKAAFELLQAMHSGFRSPLPRRRATVWGFETPYSEPPTIQLPTANRTPEKSPNQTRQCNTSPSVSSPSVTPSPIQPTRTSFNLPSPKGAYPVTRWNPPLANPPPALFPLPPAARCMWAYSPGRLACSAIADSRGS